MTSMGGAFPGSAHVRRRSVWPTQATMPDFRLTIRRGTVLAIDWGPWLVSGGPMHTMLRARGRAGTAIADVDVVFEDEVAVEAVVRFVAGDSPKARATLTRWAT